MRCSQSVSVRMYPNLKAGAAGFYNHRPHPKSGPFYIFVYLEVG